MKTLKFFAAVMAVAAAVSCGSQKTAPAPEVDIDFLDADQVEALKAQFADELPSVEATDSISYLWGANLALAIMSNGFADNEEGINMKELMAGIEDALKAGAPEMVYSYYGAQPKIDSVYAAKFKISPAPEVMQTAFSSYITKKNKFKEEVAAEALNVWIENNANYEDVKSTESGLRYILHDEGEGDKVTPTDVVVVSYKGTLLDGTEFDANDSTSFVANRVIKGWTEGLSLVGKGGRLTLFVPSKLGYGARQQGPIPANSNLIFEVEVLDIQKNEK